eukprot:8389335-Alexandrium_andersonii.AAC.1
MALERLQQAGVPTPPCFLARGLLPKRALLKLDRTYDGTFWRDGAEVSGRPDWRSEQWPRAALLKVKGYREKRWFRV